MKKLGLWLSCSVLVGTTVALSASPAASSSDQRGAIKIKDDRILSQGARAWFLGPQQSGPSTVSDGTSVAFGSNVDAADPNEDLAGGQSETAIAADGSRVLAAWNDATGFLVRSPTSRRGSLTGLGFSVRGAQSFV